jgi:methylase of polypeptide subunit release factors
MKDSIEELIAKIPTSEQERASYLYNDMKVCFSLEEPFTFLDMGTGSGSMAAVILNQFGGSRGELGDVISRLKIR